MTAAVVSRGFERQGLRSEQGQTLVEFALILPILLVLVIGIFDFGTAFNSKNDLNFLANTAARYAEVNQCAPCSSGQTIAQYVKNSADTSKVCNTTCITFCLPPGSSGNVGDSLQVSATGPLNVLGVSLPGIPKFGTSLTSTVIVRILQPSDGSLYNASASC